MKRFLRNCPIHEISANITTNTARIEVYFFILGDGEFAIICHGAVKQGLRVSKSYFANIFMIDDDRDDIYATQKRLSESNISNHFLYETDPENFFSKLENMNVWEDGKPNLIILLDLNMPGMNGYEVLKRLKENESYARIPVLMLCKSDDVVDMLESFEFGADGYLVKPVVPSEMLAVINDLASVKLQLVH